MAWNLPLEVLPHAISGVLLAGFSVWVGMKGAGSPRSRAFALFGVSFGLFGAVSNQISGFGDLTRPAAGAVAGATALMAVSGLLAASTAYGLHRLTGLMVPGGIPGWILLAVGAIVFSHVAPLFLFYDATTQLIGPWLASSNVVLNVASDAMLTVMWSAAIAAALAYPRMDPSGARDLCVLAVVASVYPAQLMTFLSVASIWTLDPWHVVSLVATLTLVLATTAAWLRAGERRGGSRAATLVALLPLATAVLMAWVFFQGGASLSAHARVLVVVVLAYAVLRHQMFGLDAKVRFAISKSTLAAVFVAVFFVASEAAQQFFGSTFRSAYVGIAAAGALVFALAPLQRAAERLSEKAVPVAGPSAADRREEVFQKAARLALRGGLSRDEEVHLAELAEELGLGAGRAATLLREVERETGAARPGV